MHDESKSYVHVLKFRRWEPDLGEQSVQDLRTWLYLWLTMRRLET